MEVKGYSGGNGSNYNQRQIKALQYGGNLYRWKFQKIRKENVESIVFLQPHHPKRIFPFSRDTITVQSRANADLKRAITDDIQCIFLTIEIIQQKLGNVKMPFLSWINACFRLSKMSHTWMMPWLAWLAFMLRVYCVFFKWQVAVFYGWIRWMFWGTSIRLKIWKYK